MNKKILAHRVVGPIPAFLILLALLAACSPTLPLPLTGGATPTLVSTVVIPTVQAPTTAPTAAPVSPTTAPAPTMTMSTPANPPASAPSGSVPATGAQQVTIAGFAFTPAALTVSAGSTVTWTNHDSVAHTVTADNGAFDSGSLAPGATFKFTFKQPGTFAYHCQFHPNMVAKVTVSAGSAAAPAAVMPTATKPAAIQQPAPAPQNQAGVQLVSIANFAFSPDTLTIPAGTKVRWTNNDTTTHTVTADSGTFDSGPLAPGATFAVTFSQAGTYTYHCKIHPNMVGKVIVTGPGASPANPGSGSGGGMNGAGGSGSGSGGHPGGSSGGSSGGYHY